MATWKQTKHPHERKERDIRKRIYLDKPVSVFYLHVRLSGNVVLEILHWADQERNVTGQNLEKAKPTQTTKTEKDGRGNTLKYL